MKHALLITAYKDFELLYRMIKQYCNQYQFDCYIHVDKKSFVSKAWIQKIESLGHVKVIQKYRINWGSYLHPKAFVELLKMAKDDSDYDFYHFISANTFVGKSPKEVDTFFENNKEKNFIEIIPFKGTESEKAIEEWYKYYHYPFLYNKKGRLHRLWDYFEMYYIRLQKKLGVCRNVDFSFKGYVYCHINKEFAAYLLSYLEAHKEYFNLVKYCHVGEEFFFQNIIMNSPYSKSVVNNSLIFDDWSPERERPAILNMDDYEKYKQSEKIFLRKIEDREDSVKLMDSLCEEN